MSRCRIKIPSAVFVLGVFTLERHALHMMCSRFCCALSTVAQLRLLELSQLGCLTQRGRRAGVSA